MPSYVDTFGGETVNPVLLSFVAYETAVDLVLVWPMEAPPDANVAADKIDVNATAGSLSVTVPPANQTSVGQDILIRNTGANTFVVHDVDGFEIGSLDSGEAWYFVVIDNSDEAGDWYAIEFGAGTSSATAASLAGAGLRASMNRLDQNLLTTSLSGNYAVTTGDRATVLQNTGGAVIWTFAAVGTLTDGWFIYAINAGNGSLVLTPSGGATIDGSATKTLAPTESCAVFCDGTNFHSLGYGRSIVNTVSGASINAAGSGTLTLSSSEIQAQVQDFSGTLTGNKTIDYGGGVGYWFIYNNTSGAYSLTMRVNGLDAGVAVDQGSFSIIRSNGTNMEIAFTAAAGTVTNIATGTGLTGGPITTTGTISLANTAVTPGTYGDADEVSTFTVDQQGRLTAASETAIQIVLTQVDPFSSATLLGRLTDETGTGLAVFSDSPALAGNPTAPTQTSTNNSTRLATTAFVFDWAANNPALTTNPTTTTQSPGNNSTRIATTAFVTAAVAVKQNFAATQSGATTLNHNVTTKMICDVQTFENGGNYYDPTTGRHTPLVAGTYAYNATAGINGVSAANFQTNIMVYKNGALLPGASVIVYRPTGGIVTFGYVNALVEMNGTTDYIEVFLNQTNDLTGNTATDPTQCAFQGWRV